MSARSWRYGRERAHLPDLTRRLPGRWAAPLPYALAWFGAILCMFGSIALVDVVLASILQSTRGIISFGLGAGLTCLGMHRIDTPATGHVVLQRAIAAAMVTAAIAMYTLG